MKYELSPQELEFVEGLTELATDKIGEVIHEISHEAMRQAGGDPEINLMVRAALSRTCLEFSLSGIAKTYMESHVGADADDIPTLMQRFLHAIEEDVRRISTEYAQEKNHIPRE